MENLKLKLGMRIKHLRKAQNITQDSLAEMLNMDITSLSKIETGRNYPQPETVEKISKALGVEVGQMFTFKNEYSPQEYIELILKNIEFLKNDTDKLRMIYSITSSML